MTTRIDDIRQDLETKYPNIDTVKQDLRKIETITHLKQVYEHITYLQNNMNKIIDAVEQDTLHEESMIIQQSIEVFVNIEALNRIINKKDIKGDL
jgi:hypothetical protein